MKTWLKRTLIGVFGVSALLGAAACSHHRHGWHGTGMSDADRAAWYAHVMERASRKLDLDEAQKARLTALADTVVAQRRAIVGHTADPRAEAQAILAGPRLDRERALALVAGKTSAVREASPAVIAAVADFYDSLRPEQQQQVRDFVARAGRRHAWGH